MDSDIRWEQRFENFDRAVRLLGEPIAQGIDTLSALEREGTIQRFEIALELAWKTLKDYLVHEGLDLSPITPCNVIKAAFESRVLPEGQVWIDMINHRNLLSHTYDERTFEKAVQAIRDRYYPAIADLHKWLKTKRRKR